MSYPLNDIRICGSEQCQGPCSNAVGLCQNLIVAEDADAADSANVIYTNDYGTAWADPAAQPFAVAEDIVSVECFQTDQVTTRWLAARGAEAAPANPAEIAYSDDGGATWALVDVEAGGTRYAAGGRALFVLDPKHIWFVTSGGYVFFSRDGGVTWENQEDGNVTGSNLLAVMFVNQSDGFIIGDAGDVIKTTDGGITWELVTDPTGVATSMSALWVFDKYNVMVGDINGEIWRSWDGGETWTQIYTGTTSINGLSFANSFVGFMVTDNEIYRTRNGGEDWELVTDAFGASTYNAVVACDENYAYVAGENSGGDGVVIRVHG
jgi:photosystem II stability/assembly factor-like uncharacterized protein